MCVLSVSDQPISPRQHTLTNFINIAREGWMGRAKQKTLFERETKKAWKSLSCGWKHFREEFFTSSPSFPSSRSPWMFYLFFASFAQMEKSFPSNFVLFVNIFSAFRGQLWRCFIYDSRECFLCRSLSNAAAGCEGGKFITAIFCELSLFHFDLSPPFFRYKNSYFSRSPFKTTE